MCKPWLIDVFTLWDYMSFENAKKIVTKASAEPYWQTKLLLRNDVYFVEFIFTIPSNVCMMKMRWGQLHHTRIFFGWNNDFQSSNILYGYHLLLSTLYSNILDWSAELLFKHTISSSFMSIFYGSVFISILLLTTTHLLASSFYSITFPTHSMCSHSTVFRFK